MTVAFVRVSNRKEKYEVLLRVDIEDDNAQVVSTRGGDPIVAPDGLTWANTLYSEKESIRVNEDEAEGYCIGVPDRVSSGRFSPDSRFILADFYNKNSQGGKRSIIGIIPESFDTQPYHVPITEFPPASLPNGSAPGLSNREVFFSADGMHLICVRYNQFREGEYEGDFLREAIPYLRLSWDYALPVPKNEHERYNKYSGQKKKPIKLWDPSKKVLLKKRTCTRKEGRYVQARDHDRYFRQESTHLWQTLLRLCFFDRVLCLADHLFGRADPQYSPGGKYQFRHQ